MTDQVNPLLSENLNQTAAAADAPTREDWKFPLWASFKNWVAAFGGALVVVVLLLLAVAWYLINYQPNAAPTTQPAIPVGVTPPTPSASPQNKLSAKTAIKKKATQAINTPTVAINSPEITPSAAPPEPLTPAEQDFANRLSIFEGKTP